MVDSRAKGARGEYLVRDLLRNSSGLVFERVPSSGALAYLKGDLYVPHENNKFCIEVKNYQDQAFDSKIFTNKSNNFLQWWAKVVDQAALRDQEPILFFKHNRSKVFVATRRKPVKVEKYVYVNWLDCYVALAEEWLKNEEVEWVEVS